MRGRATDAMTLTVADVMTLDPVVIGADAALEEAERLLRERHVSGLPVVSLLDHLPLVTCIARVSDSKTLHVSPSIERLLGITAEQALREPDFWSARLHPLDRLLADRDHESPEGGQ